MQVNLDAPVALIVLLVIGPCYGGEPKSSGLLHVQSDLEGSRATTDVRQVMIKCLKRPGGPAHLAKLTIDITSGDVEGRNRGLVDTGRGRQALGERASC